MVRPNISFMRYRHWMLALALITGGLLGGGRPPAARAQGRSPIYVPGQYIIVLKDDVGDPDATAADMARQHGLGLLHVYAVALKGFAAILPEGRLRRVAADPRVKYVEPDGVCFAIARKPRGPKAPPPPPPAQDLPTGINRIDAEICSTLAGDGSGTVNVDVAVIDTGIQIDHPDLNVVGGSNFTTDGSASYADGHGHGTHVAGTIGALDNEMGVVGMAPGARLWAVKVLDSNGSGTWSGVIAGVDWVAARAGSIEVANMSLSGSYNSSVNSAVENAVAKGVVFAVAAGNSGANASFYSPASAYSAITVAALADYNGLPEGGASPTCNNYGPDDTFATFSNYGTIVDVIAPGVCINSTWIGGGYNTISGTSMATPHIAGAAALCRSRHPEYSPAEVLNALKTAPGTEYIWGYRDSRYYPLINVSSF